MTEDKKNKIKLELLEEFIHEMTDGLLAYISCNPKKRDILERESSFINYFKQEYDFVKQKFEEDYEEKWEEQ